MNKAKAFFCVRVNGLFVRVLRVVNSSLRGCSVNCFLIKLGVILTLYSRIIRFI